MKQSKDPLVQISKLSGNNTVFMNKYLNHTFEKLKTCYTSRQIVFVDFAVSSSKWESLFRRKIQNFENFCTEKHVI